MALFPDSLDLHLWRGATLRKRLTLYTDAAGTVPRDLTGYSAALAIKDAVGGSTLTTLTSTNGGIVLGGATGTIDLVMSAAATTALSWTRGVYALTITAGSGGDTDALLTGRISIEGI